MHYILSNNLRYTRWILPITVICLMCYGSCVYAYLFCYRELYLRLDNKVTSVILLVVECILCLIIWSIWMQVIIVGPGKQPRILPFRIIPEPIINNSYSTVEKSIQSLIPPNIYQCDKQGYPIWCSNCQSLKMERTHHSTMLNQCIPRFDHFCVWIGTVIGRRNYRLFIQFVFYFILFFIFILGSIASFISRIANDLISKPKLGTHIIIVMIVSGIFLTMLIPFFFTYIYYMAKNRTAIEAMSKKKKSRSVKRYFCFYNHGDGYRYIIESPLDGFQDYYDKGKCTTNICEFIGTNIIFWFVPIGTNILPYVNDEETNYYKILGPYVENLGNRYKGILMEKMLSGQYITRLKIEGDKYKDC